MKSKKNNRTDFALQYIWETVKSLQYVKNSYIFNKNIKPSMPIYLVMVFICIFTVAVTSLLIVLVLICFLYSSSKNSHMYYVTDGGKSSFIQTPSPAVITTQDKFFSDLTENEVVSEEEKRQFLLINSAST